MTTRYARLLQAARACSRRARFSAQLIGNELRDQAVGLGVAVAKIPEIAPQPVRFRSPETNSSTIMAIFQLFSVL